MRNRREPAVAVGTQAHALDRRRAIADHREHLLSGEGQLHRSPRNHRRHHRENHVCVGEELGTEPTADIRRDHAHALGWESERLRDIVADPVCALVRIIQGDAVPAPRRDRRMRFERIVVVCRRRIGVVERDSSLC